MTTTLAPYEIEVAKFVGGRRFSESRAAGLQPRATDGRTDLLVENVFGAAAEVAVGRALGLYWPPSVNTFRSIPDVGPYEVRATMHPHGRLWIRDSDADDRAFILVRGALPTFTLIGWQYGRDGKRDAWRIHQAGYDARCYFVPTDALRAIDELPIRVVELLPI